MANRSSSIPKYWGGGGGRVGRSGRAPSQDAGASRAQLEEGGCGESTHQAQEAAELLQGPHTAQESKTHGENS